MQVERDYQLRLHRPLAVAHLAVGRQVHTAAAPQRPAVTQVDQPGTRAITGAHIEVTGADAAILVQVEAEGDLLAAFTQLHVRGIDPGQVGIVPMALQALVAEANALAVVLITQGDLVALVTVKPALRQRGVKHAEVAQPHVAAQATQCQRLSGFGVGFQGEAVADAVTQAGRRNAWAVCEIAYGVITAQTACGHRIIRQAFLQQATGYIERQGGRHLPAQRIGSNDHRLPRAIDEGHVGQGVRAWL